MTLVLSLAIAVHFCKMDHAALEAMGFDPSDVERLSCQADLLVFVVLAGGFLSLVFYKNVLWTEDCLYGNYTQHSAIAFAVSPLQFLWNCWVLAGLRGVLHANTRCLRRS